MLSLHERQTRCPPGLLSLPSCPRTFRAVRLRLFLPLLLLELHVSVVHHGARQLVEPRLLLGGEAQDVNGALALQENVSAG